MLVISLNVVILVLVIKNGFEALRQIRIEAARVLETNFLPLYEPISVKLGMMRRFLLICISFYIYKIALKGTHDLSKISVGGAKETRIQRALLDDLTEYT